MKIFIISIFLLISSITFSQEKFKVKLPTKTFTNSFIYNISSETVEDFEVKIIAIKNKKTLFTKKIKKQTTGQKTFKIDLSLLSKGKYFFIVSNGKNDFKQKIIKN